MYKRFEKKVTAWKGLKTFLGGTALTAAIAFFGTPEGADMLQVIVPGVPAATALAILRMLANVWKTRDMPR